MNKKIIIDSGFSQNRVAILEDGVLVEYHIESREKSRLVGNIYRGRVETVLPGMEAAFINIGYEKNAFLHIKDVIPKKEREEKTIKDLIKSGQEITVQVIKDPFDNKGPRVTKNITFPGRYIVLMPNSDYIGVSRRIEDEDERNRLKEIVSEIKPEGMGIIIRTEAENKGIEEIKEDLNYLLKIYNKIKREEMIGYAPKLLYQDLDLIHRTIRDVFNKDVEEVIINDREAYDSVRSFAEIISPGLKDRIKYFDPGLNVFDYFGIEKMIHEALSRKVWLKSGGYLIIEKTEAMTIIDVNTGKFVGTNNLEDTIWQINKEAAVEISRQLRLRDIGGIIIVDFIDMESKERQEELIEILSQHLSKDKIKTNILGMTNLGLLEMTRKKVRNRISSILERECPYCKGSGKVYSIQRVIFNIEKEIKRISVHTNSEAVIIGVNDDVYSAINSENEWLENIKARLGIEVIIIPEKNLHVNNYEIKFMGRLEKAYEILNN